MDDIGDASYFTIEDSEDEDGSVAALLDMDLVEPDMDFSDVLEIGDLLVGGEGEGEGKGEEEREGEGGEREGKGQEGGGNEKIADTSISTGVGQIPSTQIDETDSGVDIMEAEMKKKNERDGVKSTGEEMGKESKRQQGGNVKGTANEDKAKSWEGDSSTTISPFITQQTTAKNNDKAIDKMSAQPGHCSPASLPDQVVHDEGEVTVIPTLKTEVEVGLGRETVGEGNTKRKVGGGAAEKERSTREREKAVGDDGKEESARKVNITKSKQFVSASDRMEGTLANRKKESARKKMEERENAQEAEEEKEKEEKERARAEFERHVRKKIEIEKQEKEKEKREKEKRELEERELEERARQRRENVRKQKEEVQRRRRIYLRKGIPASSRFVIWQNMLKFSKKYDEEVGSDDDDEKEKKKKRKKVSMNEDNNTKSDKGDPRWREEGGDDSDSIAGRITKYYCFGISTTNLFEIISFQLILF